MNKQLTIEYHMATGNDPINYDIDDTDNNPTQEYIEWVEDNYLTLKNKKPESVFFLLGEYASKEYAENGIDGVIKEYEADEIIYEKYEFNGDVAELAYHVNRWNEYVIIDQYEFNQL